MDGLMVALSVVLPWAAGIAWLRFLPRSAPLPWAIAIGYGHFIGLLFLTLAMRAWSFTARAIAAPPSRPPRWPANGARWSAGSAS